MWFGLSGLERSQGDFAIAEAENAFAEIDSKAAMVALGGSPAQKVNPGLSSEGNVHVTDDGWIRVRLLNVSNGTVETNLLNQTLGSIIYERSGTTIAYEGGGVWRLGDNGSVMVSPPEFHYRDTTLTMPIVNVSGSASHDQVQITDAGSRVQKYPNQSADLTNPVRDRNVNITVHSRYYEAWGRYFEERTEGTVVYDHSNQTVTLRLVSSPTGVTTPIQGAITSSAAGETIVLDNNAIMNAYNSSAGESPAPNGASAEWQGGTIRVAGKFKLDSGNVRVVANVTTAGTIVFDSTNVRMPQGDVRCTEGNHGCVENNTDYDPIQSGSMINTSTTIEFPDPVTSLVLDKLDAIRTRNDNDETGNVTGDRLDWSNKSGNTLVLHNGTYYLSKIEMANAGNQVLVLNTSGGDIELAVDGNFHLDGTAIKVRGDTGTVRVYADISSDYQHGGNSGDLDFTGGEVKVQNASGTETFESPRFWIYAPAGIAADLKYGSRETDFTGVIYAPDETGPSGAHGTVQVTSSTVNGAIVGHLQQTDEGDKQAQISFDEALLNATTVQSTSTPNQMEVTNMHIGVNPINTTG